MSTKFIIDTNVLIQNPEVLSRGAKHNLIIPRAVFDELSLAGKGSRWRDITTLLLLSADRGRVAIESASSDYEFRFNPSDRNAQGLNGTDFETVRLALEYAEKNTADSPCVVTNDRALAFFLSDFKVDVISGEAFLEQSKYESINEDIKDKAAKVVSSQKRYLTISFTLGIVTSILASLLYSNINQIVETISVWGTLIGLPVLGVMLFWYRENYRLSYGTFEFCVGVLMSYYVFIPNFDYEILGVTEGIQILGGLYVMVRGLDNIAKAIVGTRLEPLWKKLF
ncbi:TPA: hypothetical protein NGU14_004545 [Vibrio parahaemolyticus]|nr:hypothetical protein [Vibrio parahaemolyticus]HCG8456214.1 hypothetical protein [Vibrio parahaemolyticus]